ncbi:Wzz/FepE/Etk N-terminal domain-containing protein [Erwinia sorbitola]|uniref:Polysaccharide chain length determinant N-terminal domain-containing protein n=1 Tax=Erwinia sorbitola TaxID=2681984 RepID=A0A6I6E999_9GAMM|nr:Wzz/FepE/Etk N-terminal domain-containing protein [Erwinia sorbitola]QGU86307.1 hypothetical protein GN242_03285 [Erwinia sorbitola]
MSTRKLIDDVRLEHSTVVPRTLHAENNELNLMKLLDIFIQRKLTIAFFVMAALLGGIVVNYFLPQRWTSTAIIIPPQAEELQGMVETLSGFSVLEINTKITPELLLSDFMHKFDSRQIREKYLINTPYFTQKAANVKAEHVNLLIDQVLNGNMTSRKSVLNKNDLQRNYYEVAFSANSAAAARDLLSGYIRFFAGEVQQKVRQRLMSQIELLREKSQGQYQTLLDSLEISQQIRLERLGDSLAVARSAGVITQVILPGHERQEKEDAEFSIMQGTESLERRLRVEQALSDVEKTSLELHDLRLYRERLDALKPEEITVQPFKYMLDPSLPVREDGAGQRLILVLAALMGLIVGCIWVLLSYSSKYRAQAKDIS